MDAATQHPSDDEEIHDTSGTFAHTTVFFIFVVQKPSIINTFPLYFSSLAHSIPAGQEPRTSTNGGAVSWDHCTRHQSLLPHHYNS